MAQLGTFPSKQASLASTLGWEGIAPHPSVYCVAHAGVDHCAQDHDCEQLCLNTEESFVCQCSEGFLINEDLKTCSSESPLRLSGREGLETPVGYAAPAEWQLGHGAPFLLGVVSTTTSHPHPPSPVASLTGPRGPHLGLGFPGADYCLLSDHGCEYACVNTDRSFACQCPEGHVLRSDGKTCASESRHFQDSGTVRTRSVRSLGVGVALMLTPACAWCPLPVVGPVQGDMCDAVS